MQKSVLGKGLSALIPEGSESYKGEHLAQIPIDEICLNPLQPRKRVEEEKVDELARSIKKFGLLQPVIITRKDGLYHLVVGERRLRAVKKLGLKIIPALIKEYAWDEMLKVALVENIQREDLNAIEEARSFNMLMEEYNLTQEQVAEAIDRSRPYVANTLRLLNLPRLLADDIEAGLLTAGHGRAILGLDNEREMMQLADKIKKEGLSVRQTEELVRKRKQETSKKEKPVMPPLFRHVRERLTDRLSARVEIRKGKGKKGKIEIHFADEEELERLVSLLGADEEMGLI